VSDASPEPALRVRPYALTGGRTKPKVDYPIEALVVTEQKIPEGALRTPEDRAIADLCRETQSVAEVAALVKLPLGVVRVFIADLVDRGALQVHTTGTTADSTPDAALLERVLSGLRNL